VAVSAAGAAVAAGWRADAPPAGALAAQLASTVLLTYAQLLFSRSRTVGALLLVATFAAPGRALVGLACVGVALGTAAALRLPPEQRRSGQLSYNALMAGLCLSAVAPWSPGAAAVIAAAAVASVLLTAALHVALGVGHGLPMLTLPFLAVGWVALGALPPGAAHLAPADPLGAWLGVGVAPAYLRTLASLLCVPRVDAGVLVLAALLTHSRIAAALSAVTFALAWAVAPRAGLDCLLVAVALGGVWFIPSAWSYALALGGAAVCALVAVGLAPRFERLGLPLWILPFNLTVPLVLAVMRQRVADGRPHAVDFAPGTPEQNLAYFRSRSERFGAVLGVRLGPPFRGRWTCSQGVSGGVTHEGPWRHALDFVVRGDDGRDFRSDGATLDDYGCYGLPVVAPAAGVVARVVDGVRDNPVGEVNLQDNWGNVVIVYHAPGVYSCVAHLSPGSLAVREGQAVVAGETLGRCGNSGRSATPHLHLQLQASAEVGAATIPLALHDAVIASELRAEAVPAAGDAVRAVVGDDDRRGLLRFEYLRPLRVRVEGGAEETLVPDIDLLGRHLLRSVEREATLYYAEGPEGFTVLDVVGDARSALHLIRCALSRVPFDADDALRWTDRVPLRGFLPAWARPLFDVLSPFGGPSSLALRYAVRRHGRSLLVEATSERRTRDGRPWVSTTACLAPRVGLVRLDVQVRGRRARLWIEPAPPTPKVSHEGSSFSIEGGLAHAQR
jgi:murein DD-endopeptidase MepM/ murein hydrolase activator NlpD/urea transporter